MELCIIAITAMWCAFFVAKVFGYINPRKARHGGFLLLLAIVATLYGGSKPPSVPSMKVTTDIPFIRLISSQATTDDVVLSWKYDTQVLDDKLHIDVRPKGSESDDDWVSYFVGNVWGLESGANDNCVGTWAGTIPDAVNKECYIWCEYVPPPIVHTNGVFHLDGVMRAMDDETESKFVTPGIMIDVDGEVVTPTKED